MRKVICILLLGLIAGGCSVFRHNGSTGAEITGKINSGNVLEDIENQNLTQNGFFIQKAEIEFNTSDATDKFIASIKFEKPDRYLISLKSRTGIEGARIFISGDSIRMNDRINKKLYSGTSIYLEKKYGFSQSFLPLIFGDLILEKRCKTGLEKCIEDKLTLDCQIKGVPLSYVVDCKRLKVIMVDQVKSVNNDGMKISYAKYFNPGNILIPRIIEFSEINYDIRIKIKVLKIQSSWNGHISFIPGKDYELIELK